MRALVALVTCVILLAVIQGSYLVIDAHHNKPLVHVTGDVTSVGSTHARGNAFKYDDKQQDKAHNQVQPIRKEDQKQHSQAKHRALDRTSDDRPKRDCHQYPEGCPVSTPKAWDGLQRGQGHPGSSTSTYSILRPSLKKHQLLEEHRHHAAAGKDSERVPLQPGDDANPLYIPIHSSNIYGNVYSNNPENGDKLVLDSVPDNLALSNNPLRDNLHVNNPRDMQPIRHQRDRKKSRGRRKGCRTHRDCDQDDCCLTRHKGPAYCSTGQNRRVGGRCTDSCICELDLECFVTEINKFGRQRKKSRFHPLVGRCEDPSTYQNLQGYWATYNEHQESSPVPN